MDLEEALVAQQIINDLMEAEEDDNRPKRKFLRKEDPFAFSDEIFIKNFRLNKDLVRELINLLSPFLTAPSRASALSIDTKILATLHFYGHGTYQEGVGKHIFAGLSQASVSRCIHEVTNALNQDEIVSQFIKFPENINQLRELRTRFYRKYQFPGVVGCIDCTHVALVAPKENEHIYVNRKKYHSINVQLVCDERLKIMNVNSRYPGSSHDAYIWRNSNIAAIMERIHRNYQEPFFLLGDSGYPLRPWLQTVIVNPEPGPEEIMNNRLKSVRSSIERCNGVLKNRFRCLLRHRVLHYDPSVAAKIIVACSILHNMCIDANIPEPVIEENNVDYGIYVNAANNVIEDQDEVAGRVNPNLLLGRQLQRQIIRNHFTNN